MKKILLFVLIGFFNSTFSIAQFGDFDDTFNFAGANLSIEERETAFSGDCGTEVLILKWSFVQQDRRYVNSYSLQAKINNRWTTIENFPVGRSVYRVNLSNLKQEWIDDNAKFQFRVRVNVKIDFIGDVFYSQGRQVTFTDWCFGPRAQIILNSATFTSGGRTWNLKNGQIPTLNINNIGSRRTDPFSIYTSITTQFTNFGSRSPAVTTYLSDCPVLGRGCGSRNNINTEEYGFDLIDVPFRVPSGTTRTRRTNQSFRSSIRTSTLVDGVTYYIHVRYAINRTNTVGFVWPFKINFNDVDTSGNCFICPNPIDDGLDEVFRSRMVINQPYMLEVFDLSGNKVLSKSVSNSNEENQILSNLPKQVYIIQNKDGTRKELIN